MKLSVVIITKDEEAHIERCLEQIRWADEIVVVDAFSRDRTAEIAKRYTDKVISRHWANFVDQRNFALGLATGDFILILDADEVIDEYAKDSIKKVLGYGGPSDGYYFMNKTYFLGRRLFFSQWPNRIMRFFKREKGFVAAKADQLVDEAYGVRGAIGFLMGTIKNYTSDTIAERIKKIDIYSTLWAEQEAARGAKEPSAFQMVYAPIKSFIGNFFIKGGFLDGYIGFLWCGLKASENFLKYAKLYHLLTARFSHHQCSS